MRASCCARRLWEQQQQQAPSFFLGTLGGGSSSVRDRGMLGQLPQRNHNYIIFSHAAEPERSCADLRSCAARSAEGAMALR
ncbi:hypothetical protein FQA47_014558 [Oryzias melastigma]|uniref:Uncharacterized protein n=1 Tax=Oryzias melastigma TaxID=30732 RepID=A0A834KX39_ORYME|nr:hypothetical protein FQA47_014558 [Oryzias melastigma]